jgi:hypothetical protein
MCRFDSKIVHAITPRKTTPCITMTALAPPVAPRIALIHATALAMQPVNDAFARHWPQARRMHLLDDSLSVDHAAAGGQLNTAMLRRFDDLAQYAKRAGCDGILFTCSAFGAAIEAAGASVGLPTLKPNEAMLEDALALCTGTGDKIGLLATFEASIPSMAAELYALANARGLEIELQSVFVPEAMQDLAEGRADAHHHKIALAAQTLKGCQVVMLAQFSMAAALPVVQPQLVCRVLSSPDCAVLALQHRMNCAPNP